jgi:hypothetical protein
MKKIAHLLRKIANVFYPEQPQRLLFDPISVFFKKGWKITFLPVSDEEPINFMVSKQDGSRKIQIVLRTHSIGKPAWTVMDTDDPRKIMGFIPNSYRISISKPQKLYDLLKKLIEEEQDYSDYEE